MRKFLVAVAVVTFLGGAACGGGDPKAKDKTEPTSNGGAAAATIKASGTTWDPEEVTVKAGEVVEWDVNGSIVHDVKGDDDVERKPGSKFVYTHTYDKAGTYAFQCTIHPGMTGTVTVEP